MILSNGMDEEGIKNNGCVSPLTLHRIKVPACFGTIRFLKIRWIFKRLAREEQWMNLAIEEIEWKIKKDFHTQESYGTAQFKCQGLKGLIN